MKTLKVIGKKVTPVPVEVPVPGKKIPKKRIRSTPRVQQTIHEILYDKKPIKTAMLDNGYTPASAQAHMVTKTKQYKEALEYHVNQLTMHRNEILEHMRSIYDKAPYAALSMSLASISSQIQLLTGKATGRLGFELPEEAQNKIREIIENNAGQSNT